VISDQAGGDVLERLEGDLGVVGGRVETRLEVGGVGLGVDLTNETHVPRREVIFPVDGDQGGVTDAESARVVMGVRGTEKVLNDVVDDFVRQLDTALVE
jgi:hypothetical protein